MKKSFLSLLTLALGLLLGACSMEEDFRPDTGTRLSNTVDEYTALLGNSSKTWLLSYYPDKARRYGGFALVLRFEGNRVTARHELGEGTPVTSGYRFSTTDGVMLSFDEFNSEIYTQALPTQDYPDAYGGEIDFIVDSYENEVFSLRGRLSGNRMFLRPIEEDMNTYISDVQDMGTDLWGADISPVTIAGQEVSFALNDRLRQLSYTTEGQTRQVPYMYTPGGILLYEPITIGGQEITELLHDEDSNTLSLAPGVSAAVVPFPAELGLASRPLTLFMHPSYVAAPIYRVYTRYRFARSNYMDPALSLGNGELSVFRSRYRSATSYSTYTVDYMLGFSAVAGQSDQIRITDYGVGRNHKYYFEATDIGRLLVANSPYRYERTEAGDFKLTSVANQDFWFYVGESRYNELLPEAGARLTVRRNEVSPSFYELFTAARQEIEQVSSTAQTRYSLSTQINLGTLWNGSPFATGIRFRLRNQATNGTLSVEYLAEFYPVRGESQLLFIGRDGGRNWTNNARLYPKLKELLDTMIAKSPYQVAPVGEQSYFVSVADEDFFFPITTE